ncbi:MAG TPA: MtnX-like HAD-IB family phosphatase [Thermodesulfobacteriota bacterium]|nr:MtnX-like HAD-IB family phosphatase [Thermodesulfobacteriota bacterium]
MSDKSLAVPLAETPVETPYPKPARPGRGEVIFCDFDGTVTLEDVVDKLLELYADPRWKHIETLWRQGRIGSEECLGLQLKCIGPIEERELFRFAFGIGIDPGFKDFIRTAKRSGTGIYIVSDGFDMFIKYILLKSGISAVPVFANGLRVRHSRPVPSFPFRSDECRMRSGMCKCSIIAGLRGSNAVTYIGDGESDVCAVSRADTVFAKGRLSSYCLQKGIPFTGFSCFADIKKILFKKEIKHAER